MESLHTGPHYHKSNTHFSDEHTQSTHISQPSILIQTGPYYTGLPSNFDRPSKFQSFPKDLTYKFPVLYSKKPNYIYERHEFILSDNISIKNTFAKLNEKSPFKRGNVNDVASPLETDQSSAHGPPKNSVNLNSTSYLSRSSLCVGMEPFNLAEEMAKDSFYMEKSFESSLARSELPEKPEVSINSKQLIMQMLRDYACLREDEMHRQSITPASSYKNRSGEVTPLYLQLSYHTFEEQSLSVQAEEFFSTKLEPSAIMNNTYSIEDYESRHKGLDFTSYVAELVPEMENENSEFLFKSTEALKRAQLARLSIIDSEPSPADEGSIRISAANRLFLNGHTASKAKLTNHNQVKLPNQDIQNKTNDSKVIFEIKAQDISSVLVRKAVVCEEIFNNTDTKGNSQVVNAYLLLTFAFSGFTSVPTLEFSNHDNRSSGLIDYDDSDCLLNNIFTSNILKEISHHTVKWLSCGYEHAAAVTTHGKVYT